MGHGYKRNRSSKRCSAPWSGRESDPEAQRVPLMMYEQWGFAPGCAGSRYRAPRSHEGESAIARIRSGIASRDRESGADRETPRGTNRDPHTRPPPAVSRQSNHPGRHDAARASDVASTWCWRFRSYQWSTPRTDVQAAEALQNVVGRASITPAATSQRRTRRIRAAPNSSPPPAPLAQPLLPALRHKPSGRDREP
jgi:hypothetical protein